MLTTRRFAPSSGSYGAGLDELPEVLVLNKIDLLPEPPAFEPSRRAGGVPALVCDR